VAVVGGGQTGAELFLRLERAGASGPREVTWFSSRPNFLPLDDTPFTNELFFPNYVTHFYDLPISQRRLALAQQRLASDGIDTDTLTQLYQRLYALDFLEEPRLRYRLLPGHRMVALTRRPDGLEAVAERAGGGLEVARADVVVLCTGFDYVPPACLAPLADRIRRTDDGYQVGIDFTIDWNGPAGRRAETAAAGCLLGGPRGRSRPAPGGVRRRAARSRRCRRPGPASRGPP
jgi:lysine N6-hydroxylase